jgi:amino acid transporter
VHASAPLVSAPPQAQPAREAELTRGLTLWDATMLVVGSMIGSGIFIVSADIARSMGSPGGLLLVWLVTGMVTLFGALSYGELAAAIGIAAILLVAKPVYSFSGLAVVLLGVPVFHFWRR